jgi:hypothetical protein
LLNLTRTALPPTLGYTMFLIVSLLKPSSLCDDSDDGAIGLAAQLVTHAGVGAVAALADFWCPYIQLAAVPASDTHSASAAAMINCRRRR